MFERFTSEARRAVVLAQEEARMLKHDRIGAEHLLLALLHQESGLAGQTLDSLGITLDAVRQQLRETLESGSEEITGHIPFAPNGKKVLEFSLRESLQRAQNHIGTEHLLLGLIRDPESTAVQILARFGYGPDQVRQQTVNFMSGYPDVPLASVSKVPPASPSRPARTGKLNVQASVVTQEVFRLADVEAREMRHGYVGTEHLLLGLLLARPQPTPPVLHLLGDSVSVATVRDYIVALAGAGSLARNSLPLTWEVVAAVDLAYCVATDGGDSQLSPHHLLLALGGADRSLAVRVIAEFGLRERAAAWVEQDNDAAHERVRRLLTAFARQATSV